MLIAYRRDGFLTEAERAALVAHLAANPEAGQLVPGTGGVRKIRWGTPGQGKRGGARVIYYYYNESIPLFALDIYAKNQKTVAILEEESLIWRTQPESGQPKSTPPLAKDSSGA